MKTPRTSNLSTANTSEVMHFCGHMISTDETGRFPKSYQPITQRAIESYFRNNTITSAFGSLAAGADIMIAESAARHGVELHLVFPYAIETFIQNSVLPSGKDWLPRFKKVLEQASTTTTVYQQQPKDELLSYAQCTEVAMGLGLLSANQTNSIEKAKQLTLWDTIRTTGVAGTYPDMLRWSSLGLSSVYYPTQFDSGKIQQDLSPSEFFNKEKQESLSQLPNLIAYTGSKKIAAVNQPSQVLELTIELAKKDQITWDLDRDLFGFTGNKHTTQITNRCAGVLAFHLLRNNHSTENSNLSNPALKMLKTINKMRMER